MQIVVRPCPQCGALISAPDTELPTGTYAPLMAMVDHWNETHRDPAPETDQPGQGS